MSENILVLALVAGGIVKPLVDAIRIATPLPSWGPVALAFLLSQLTTFLLLVYEYGVLTLQQGALALLAGLVAAAGAIGTTVLQKKSQQVKFKRRMDKRP